jgi:hypothetical protein
MTFDDLYEELLKIDVVMVKKSQIENMIKAKDAEIEQLKSRLEIDPSHPYDGIYTRDETIKMLYSRIDELKAYIEARGYDAP